MSNYDFLLEIRLRKLDKDLSSRHASCMALFEQMLKKFLAVFPTFTDHSLLHTLNIINISNQMLRHEVEKLNADEIYVYLMATALHDIGMGVNDKDLNVFIDSLGLRDYVDAHPNMEKATLIRQYHNDFSYAFIKKYWEIFEIPSERYANAIAEVSRGHRKTDLFDLDTYPVDYDLGGGKKANLALLSALLRLCDELDIASDRNPNILYNVENMVGYNEKSLFEFFRHEAIRPVQFDERTLVIVAETQKPLVARGVLESIKIVKKTLQYCFDLIDERSDVKIDCKEIKLIINDEEMAV